MTDKLKIVTWKWDAGIHPKKGIRFSARHVNTLYYMLLRHLDIPFELICITDDREGIEIKVKTIPLFKEFAGLPGCFRRLKIFSKDMLEIIGPRFVNIDLDVVIVDNVTDIFSRSEKFIIWGEHWRKAPYCGSFFIMDAGCRHDVYSSFKINRYQPNFKGRYPYGTDQDHICYKLYPVESMLTSKDGVYSFNFSSRRWEKGSVRQPSKYKDGGYAKKFRKAGINSKLQLRPRFLGNGDLPSGAKMIFFNGKHDPSHKSIQKEYPWVKEHWANLS